jgi:hypothetical protein
VFRPASPSQVNSLDPELVTELKILPVELEKKIKEVKSHYLLYLFL